ncbi:MAG: sodium:glutamate symporter [Lachnospiraceae bacterium]
MYGAVIAFGIASLMLCLGMILCKKVPYLHKSLIPASVIGGVTGLVLVNYVLVHINGIDTGILAFNDIVDIFFCFSFISIGLTQNSDKDPGKPKEKNDIPSKKKGIAGGIIGMSLIWCILYAITPVAAAGIIALSGKPFNIEPVYGLLIPFAFCQGPGQAMTYGRLFENVYGFENAEMVALTFAVIGYFVAFIIGIPIAKYGLEKGLAKVKSNNKNKHITDNNKKEPDSKIKSYNMGIDKIVLHISLMGVCYLIANGLSRLLLFIPGIGSSFSAMNFFWGLIVACIVRKIMEKFNISHMLDSNLQTGITGCLTDYLVCCSFMAVQINIIKKWLIPILITSIICTIITIIICLYFSARLGSDHDFERFLGLYGTCTGTVPCGMSLIKIADPNLKTGTDMELGIMNIGMSMTTPVVLLIMMTGLQKIPLFTTCIIILVVTLIYIILLKVFRAWGKPTFYLIRR